MRGVLVERAAAEAADVADHEPRRARMRVVERLGDREQEVDELGAAVAPVAAVGHPVERRVPGRPEGALHRQLHAVDEAPVVGQAERDGVAPDDIRHDRGTAASRGLGRRERREVRERRRTEGDRRQRDDRRAATADQQARDRRRCQHERRDRGQEAALEAALALVRPGAARRPYGDRPRDDDGDGLRLGSDAQDPRRRDLGPAARGHANALALDERKLLRSRVATATCLDSGHAFILVLSPESDPGPAQSPQPAAIDVRPPSIVKQPPVT